jgi:nicotinate-nucleotide adenylyltransferase
MRIALFGGTFDPPHRGHLAIARAAADALELASVLFAPVGLQPLKENLTATSFADRLAMVQLACQADPRFQASSVDAPREDGLPNYTVETLAELRSLMPSATIFNLVGADSFLSLRSWREPQRLLELAEWIVVSRPGSPLNDLSRLRLTEVEFKRIHLIETVHEEVSATDLRRRLAAGEECDDLIPTQVAKCIHNHSLYRSIAKNPGPAKR